MKIGVIVAMDKEFAQLAALLQQRRDDERHGRRFLCGRVGANEVILQKCGIGKVNAAVGAVEMVDGYAPDWMVSTGVAGGADVAINPLDVVVGTEFVYHDVYCGRDVAYGQFTDMPARFPATLPSALDTMDWPEGIAVHRGLMASGDWFVDTREKMSHILDLFPDVKAVDMESCAIAQTCWLRHVPFVSLRVISDVPLKDTHAAQYYDFWSRVAEGSFEATRRLLGVMN